MTMKSIILIFFLGYVNLTTAQVIEFGKDGTFSNNWHEGTLVLNNGKLKKGLIKFENAVSKMYGMKMIGKIRFRAEESAKKEKYKKKEIDFFTIKNNSGSIEKYSFERLSKRHYLLLRVLAEGKMNLYSEDVYNSITGFSGGYPTTNLYIKMEGDEFVEFSKFKKLFKSFKKNAIDYFADCPSIMSKINNEIYKYDDIIRIVNEYNNCF